MITSQAGKRERKTDFSYRPYLKLATCGIVYVQRLFLTNNWKAKDIKTIKEYKLIINPSCRSPESHSEGNFIKK